MVYGVRVEVEEICLKIFLSRALMFARWHGSEGGGGGMCAALQSSVQGCDYHLGWSKLGALDVI